MSRARAMRYITKMLKLWFVRKRIKNFIVSQPTIKAVKKPRITGPVISFKVKSFSFKTAAPAIIGMESKKEILALATLVKPKNKAALIVIPERETPGIIAKACAQPIKSIISQGGFLSVLCDLL